MRVLLLAGTTEAARLAELLADRPDVDVVASLAGRTQVPAALACPVRRGGFGGVDGLVHELRAGAYDALVDATHPFAAVMPRHAAAAGDAAGVPRLRLLRPPWRSVPGDDWHEVADLVAAAATLPAIGARRVLLTTGRMELDPFSALTGLQFLVRSIERPDPLPLADATVLLDRGPFTLGGELALLRDHRVDTIVTKNAGAEATAPKLVAARTLGLPVVMVRRPPPPAGPRAGTAAAAVRWLDSLRAPSPGSAHPSTHGSGAGEAAMPVGPT